MFYWCSSYDETSWYLPHMFSFMIDYFWERHRLGYAWFLQVSITLYINILVFNSFNSLQNIFFKNLSGVLFTPDKFRADKAKDVNSFMRYTRYFAAIRTQLILLKEIMYLTS